MYIDCINFKKDEKIRAVERIDGQRVYREFDPDWHFFVNDPSGTYTSIYGDRVKKIQPSSSSERHKLARQYSNRKHWESDVNVVMRTLEQQYADNATPTLNVAFFDIETDFHEVHGYCEAGEATNPITSIAIYLQWTKTMVCLAVPPKTLTWEEASAIANDMPEVILCRTEKEMLSAFLDLIEDADVLSGWNSEMYDIPFTINRIIKTLGKSETRRMSLWDQYPRSRTFERGGKEYPTYDLSGRVHLDYLQLYKNYTYEEKQSYALNNIAEIELGDKKVEYSGTLDQLYKQDFKLFLEYNIQDTMLLERLDQELQYIDLCNTIAHANCVLLPTTMGAVAVTDQAVTIEAHATNKVVPNKKRNKDADTRAAGGWVATPKKGLHKWVGSADLNSLYPSVLRALNMSPETIIGQINQSSTIRSIAEWEEQSAKNTFASWWNDRFCPLEMERVLSKDNVDKLTLDMEDGHSYVVTGADIHKLVFDSGKNWCISANGTIFRTDLEGIIPSILTRWYSERKILQAAKKTYANLEDNEKAAGYTIPADSYHTDKLTQHCHHASPYDLAQVFSPSKLATLVDNGDKDALTDYLNLHNLTVVNSKLIFRDKDELKTIVGFWDKRQLVKKINLNSAYGALLNAGSRFFDQRIGQSTTLTGRNITKHMAAKTNEYLTGVYDHYGECCIYGDTDSTYFSAYPALAEDIDAGKISWSKDDVIEIYDTVSDQVSDTFPQFMADTFHVPISRSDGVIKAGREIVAESALFIKKKRYAALVYDDEGKRMDVKGKPGKVKAMGLDLRRSDTPKFIQEFLSEILLDTLTLKGESHAIEKIREFKDRFESMRPWEKGTPKAVNNLTKYRHKAEAAMAARAQGKKMSLTIPGHVQASLNWNVLRSAHNDQHIGHITDGQKVIVCRLRKNSDNVYKSVAYPVDETHLPDWFINLPFDEEAMLEANVNKKLENLLNVLKWDLKRANKNVEHMESLFDFSCFD